MVLDPAFNAAPLAAAAKVVHYYNGVGPDWVGMCMKPIVRQYFRRENESETDFTLDGMAIASVSGQSWTDELWRVVDLGAEVGATDYEKRWSIYEQLRSKKLITMDFPEYLEMQGVAVPDQLREPTPRKAAA